MSAEYLRLVFRTTRFVYEPEPMYAEAEALAPVIVGMWHGQHFLMPFLRRGKRAKVLVSRHRDGEINAVAAHHLGVGTIRGSGGDGREFQRKGGVGAFREMLDALEQGYAMALTADVPKVSRVAGAGIVKLASLSGRPIFLVAIATSNRITLNNWDRSVVNLPFGRGAMVGDGPIYVPGQRGRCRARSCAAGDRSEAQRHHRARLRDCRRAATGFGQWLNGCRCRCAPTGWHRRGPACSRRRSSAAASRPARSIRALPRALRREQDRPSAGAAGLGSCGERRRTACGHSVDRPDPRARIQRAVHIRNGDVRRARRAAVAGGRHPPVRAARRAALRQALLQSLAARSGAVRRIGTVAQPDHDGGRARRAAPPGERPHLRARVQHVAPRSQEHRGGAAMLRAVSGAVGHVRRAIARSRRPPRFHHRQPQVRRSGAAGESRQSPQAARRHRRTYGDRRGLDPCGRRDRDDRCPPSLARHFPALAHDHCAAPSRARARAFSISPKPRT